MPFNPAYEPMDMLRFYENQTEFDDIAPVTKLVFRVNDKMQISCGGENPALNEVSTRESKAIERVSSDLYSSDVFWMVMDNAPEEATVTVPADTPTKIGEALFYAKEDLSMIQIAYTATYLLEKTTLVEIEVFVDEVSVYKTKENQFPEENRISVTTGAEVSGKESHKVEVYVTVTEATLDIGGGGVRMELRVEQNSIYDAEADFGVYGFSKVTAAVPDDIGYYGSVRELSVESEDVQAVYSNPLSYQGGVTQDPDYDIRQLYCRISRDIGDGAQFNGRYFSRTDDSYPLLFINFNAYTGYNSYGVISNHNEIPPQTYNGYGNLMPAGTLEVNGNTFYLFAMSGWWAITRDSIAYSVNGEAAQFVGSACYIHINDQQEWQIIAANSAVEADCKAVLDDFATMG